jgi:hypothetical protein
MLFVIIEIRMSSIENTLILTFILIYYISKSIDIGIKLFIFVLNNILQVTSYHKGRIRITIKINSNSCFDCDFQKSSIYICFADSETNAKKYVYQNS